MADFPPSVTTPLGRLNALANDAVTFASDVVATLRALVGDNNPFGTAALADTGTAEGNVPLLNADGEIDAALLPEATADARGAVLLARNLTDARAGVVATAAQVSALAATAGTGLNADNFTVTELASGAIFTTPAIGLIVVGAAGGGGHRPPRLPTDYLTDGAGGNAANSYLYYGDGALTATTTRVEVRGGTGGAARGNERPGNRGLNLVAVTAGTGAPDFAMILRGKGGLGGTGGTFVGDPSHGTRSLEGLSGDDGEMLVAKVTAGARYRVTLGAAGAGAAALGSAALSGAEASNAGDAGLAGYAFFVGLA